MTRIQRMVHLAMRLDSHDVAKLKEIIFAEKRQSYESQLTTLAKSCGCTKIGRASGAVLKEMKLQSANEAEGIVNTYNRDLVFAIRRISREVPKANRHTYAKRLRAWDSKRSEWKSLQISLHNIGEWQARAISDFYKYNDVTGTAQLLPRSPASCDICKTWTRRGKVKLSDAAKVMKDWPPHLGCIHSWSIKLDKANCDDLWVGVEEGDFKEMSDAVE